MILAWERWKTSYRSISFRMNTVSLLLDYPSAACYGQSPIIADGRPRVLTMKVVEAESLAVACNKWISLIYMCTMWVHTKNYRTAAHLQMTYGHPLPKTIYGIGSFTSRNKCGAESNAVSDVSSGHRGAAQLLARLIVFLTVPCFLLTRPSPVRSSTGDKFWRGTLVL